ncbi:Mth938-like domain-containing protein [Bordetella sp. FB-8]|uniref:Mth938-like domain-containing protein n=1 Tax=Bordetella sp. FB-8 TaxID=1159870 RepID=UPI00036E9551|nr:Mth938-like domain-containing protein [Bordetella sp. FB-8]
MKLHTNPATTLNTVTAYGLDYIEVNQVRFSHAVAFGPEGAVTEWPVASAADISCALLEQAAGLSRALRDPLAFLDDPESTASGGLSLARSPNAPEVLLVGTGARQKMLSPAILRPLLAAGVGIEVMDTQAAARTYNILMAEGRRVVAALLPPNESLQGASD